MTYISFSDNDLQQIYNSLSPNDLQAWSDLTLPL